MPSKEKIKALGISTLNTNDRHKLEEHLNQQNKQTERELQLVLQLLGIVSKCIFNLKSLRTFVLSKMTYIVVERSLNCQM